MLPHSSELGPALSKRAQSRQRRPAGKRAGLYIRNYHTELVQRPVHAVHDLPAEQRYISALTLSTSAATLAAVRRRVIEFRRQLVALCDADPCPSQVIQLNLQLFPLSQPIASPSGARAKPEASPTPKPARRRLFRTSIGSFGHGLEQATFELESFPAPKDPAK